jgi:hypothetical protein
MLKIAGLNCEEGHRQKPAFTIRPFTRRLLYCNGTLHLINNPKSQKAQENE